MLTKIAFCRALNSQRRECLRKAHALTSMNSALHYLGAEQAFFKNDFVVCRFRHQTRIVSTFRRRTENLSMLKSSYIDDFLVPNYDVEF